MARRTKDELLAEFHRLYDVFETIWDIRCEMDVEVAEYQHLAMSREEMLELVDRKQTTLSQAIGGTMEAINDYAVGYEMQSPSETATYTAFLDRYHKRTGRHFFQDIGRPTSTAKAILRRGRIADETEYQILNEFLVNVDQAVLSDQQIAQAAGLIDDFSARPVDATSPQRRH